MTSKFPPKQHVVAILGCGFMGTALLSGILTSTRDSPSPVNKYFACVRSQRTADHLQKTLAQDLEKVEIVCGNNAHALSGADIIVLGFQPGDVDQILSRTEIAGALQGKLIISMLAGVSCQRIQEILKVGSQSQSSNKDYRRVIRVIPSIGAQINESVSLISDSKIDDESTSLVHWIFERVGSVQVVAEELMNTAVAVSATTHALTVTAVDALCDGSVSRGLPRSVALKLAAQCLRSAASMLTETMTLEELKDSMSVPRGITTEAWIHLDAGHVRPAISQSVRNAIDYAHRMA